MPPKVSVPIATYNRANYLVECIDSVLNQTYKNIEIIVVDDGSSDNTAEIAQRYGDKIKFVSQDHRGNIATYYHARSLCTGKYMTYFGDDDLLGRDFIERAVAVLESDESVVKFCSDCFLIDANGNRIGDNETYLTDYSNLESGKKGIDDLLKSGCFVHGGVDRRQVFEKIGYYDEQFPHAADYDMYLRMTGQGHSIYFINEPLWSYRVHPKMRSHNESEMWEETIKVLELNADRFPEASAAVARELQKKLGMNKAWLAVRLFSERQFAKSMRYAVEATKNYFPSVPIGTAQMAVSALKKKRSVYRLGD